MMTSVTVLQHAESLENVVELLQLKLGFLQNRLNTMLYFNRNKTTNSDKSECHSKATQVKATADVGNIKTVPIFNGKIISIEFRNVKEFEEK